MCATYTTEHQMWQVTWDSSNPTLNDIKKDLEAAKFVNNIVYNDKENAYMVACRALSFVLEKMNPNVAEKVQEIATQDAKTFEIRLQTLYGIKKHFSHLKCVGVWVRPLKAFIQTLVPPFAIMLLPEVQQREAMSHNKCPVHGCGALMFPAKSGPLNDSACRKNHHWFTVPDGQGLIQLGESRHFYNLTELGACLGKLREEDRKQRAAKVAMMESMAKLAVSVEAVSPIPQ